ncbi:MAG: hypothetical protein K0R92_2666 [Lachnospiraceae bacterium]|jgi:hypothetical protein|nr:hypothetical protein [Lachnospiraceae bacterium]
MKGRLKSRKRWIMEEESKSITLCADNPKAVAEWLVENLFFQCMAERKDYQIVHNGSCVLHIYDNSIDWDTDKYFSDFTHVAMGTSDIDKAIDWCISRQLKLHLDNGKSFYNPKVYDLGEKYFNIVSPFGIIFEVSQHVKPQKECPKGIIYGLDHIGLPVADICDAKELFHAYGYTDEFDMVTNRNENEGTIFCIMMKKGNIILEVYQFADTEFDYEQNDVKKAKIRIEKY